MAKAILESRSLEVNTTQSKSQGNKRPLEENYAKQLRHS